jgi:hypothetical protein
MRSAIWSAMAESPPGALRSTTNGSP